MRAVVLLERSLLTFFALLFALATGMAQEVPPQQSDPSQVLPPPAFQQTPNLVIPAPDQCDVVPCIKAASSKPATAAAQPDHSSPISKDTPTSPTASDSLSTLGNANTGYEVLAPLGNAAAKALPQSNPLSIVNFPKIPSAVGYAVDGAQVAMKCFQGYQSDGLGGCVSAGGKEALGAAAQAYGTAVGTCLAAETGPFAYVIGAGVGWCARQATDYALDHPAILQGLEHAGDCDPFGNCADWSLKNAPNKADDGSSARQNMESSFDQTSDQNDAAATQAGQQAADAQAAQSSESDSGVMDFLAALSVGLNGVATLQQSQHPQTPVSAPTAPTSSPIPAGWVACTCPSQHASMGRMINGTLYHPEGPQCK